MTSEKTLLVDHRDRCVVITLNRPDAANGINAAMARELADVAADCDRDPSIKAVVLTATGRFFCAGGDVKEMSGHGADTAAGVKRLADDLHRAISTFARMPAPLIVAVNGMAAGAGFSLAAAGDLVLASDAARFTMSYTNVGLSPDGSSSWYLPWLIGLRRTQELMYTNRVLTAAEALDWGVLTTVVAADGLSDAALALADTFAAGPAGANATVKKVLLTTFDHGLESQMELEGRAIAACAGSPDGREGIAAFAQRRKPEFA